MNRPAAALTMVFLLAQVLRSPGQNIREGSHFPEIRLPDLEGKRLSVRDFRGKKTVLYVFASW